MTRMEKMIRWEINSNEIANAVVEMINRTLENSNKRLSRCGWKTRNRPWLIRGCNDERINIDDFINVKNSMHDFMHNINDIIGYAPMNIEYLIKVFYEKFGLIGVAYLRAALYSDRYATDSLVYEAELFYPGWRDLVVEVLKVIGKLPVIKERRYFYGEFVGYKLTDENDIKSIPMIYWNGRRYNCNGEVL